MGHALRHLHADFFASSNLPIMTITTAIVVAVVAVVWDMDVGEQGDECRAYMRMGEQDK